jgi:type IV pilus assembly protein PilC
MNYPVGVICVAVIVTCILLIKVVPVFAEMFESFGSELPAFTQFVVAISEWVQAYWWMVIGVIVILFVGHKEAHLRSEQYRDTIDAIALKAPVVGGIVNSSVYARFSRTLATTFAAGVPLVDALEAVAGAAGNVIYKNAIMKVREEVMSGTTLYSAMNSKGLFPSMMLQMISIGEESGALDSMLSKVATFYEDEVDNAVDGLTALMEPLIMSVLGVLVGGLMIAMYLPIFAMGSAV